MYNFSVGFDCFSYVSLSRVVSLPEKWAWRDVYDAGLFHAFDGNVALDLARWRGWLSQVFIGDAYYPPVEAGKRGMWCRSGYASWLRTYIYENLPTGFHLVCFPPVSPDIPIWGEMVAKCVWHSSASANLGNDSAAVAAFSDGYMWFAVDGVAAKYFEINGVLATEGQLIEWRNEFYTQVNDLQPPAFRWLAAVMIDIRCCHRTWKDVRGELPEWSERESAYVAAWERRNWNAFAN